MILRLQPTGLLTLWRRVEKVKADLVYLRRSIKDVCQEFFKAQDSVKVNVLEKEEMASKLDVVKKSLPHSKAENDEVTHRCTQVKMKRDETCESGISP
ncbi:uncharacterized protein A4U43_C10F9160 [Asparagus officinalis]|uniref:Uncharacterized protein n=1 Tax=Asparagus officinalis TaxID=4686 RepID=A0A5P1E1L0_ASPOF|nr:uncharacterized protein A4U43_C10F9160 [Asparagus officinalis]